VLQEEFLGCNRPPRNRAAARWLCHNPGAPLRLSKSCADNPPVEKRFRKATAQLDGLVAATDGRVEVLQLDLYDGAVRVSLGKPAAERNRPVVTCQGRLPLFQVLERMRSIEMHDAIAGIEVNSSIEELQSLARILALCVNDTQQMQHIGVRGLILEELLINTFGLSQMAALMQG
jgi:hypothetical protein